MLWHKTPKREEMDLGDREICWEILPKVSRSFALCIRILPRPLNEQMMVSYLLYRTIDTIEDSQASLQEKKMLFAKFLRLLSSEEYNGQKTDECRGEMLNSLSFTYEEVLLSNLDSLLCAYYSQPPAVRRAIRHWGRVMAGGMYKFQQKRIRTFADQDRYSYYVAGVVGYLFNDLLYHNKIITNKLRLRLRYQARRFGQALQKVNILRDVSHDVSSGRYYWPELLLNKYRLDYHSLCKSENRKAAMKVLREEIKNALAYLSSGMQYVLSLPPDALQVRMFCIIPLFMAIESYVKCIDNQEIFMDEKTVKISRLQVQEIVAKSGVWGKSNERLARWFMDTMQKAGPMLPRSAYSARLLRAQCQVVPMKMR